MFTYLGLGSSSVVNSTAGTDRGKKTATRIWPWNKFPYRGVKVHRLFCEQSSLLYPTHWTIISIKAAKHLMSLDAQLYTLAWSIMLRNSQCLFFNGHKQYWNLWICKAIFFKDLETQHIQIMFYFPLLLNFRLMLSRKQQKSLTYQQRESKTLVAQ